MRVEREERSCGCDREGGCTAEASIDRPPVAGRSTSFRVFGLDCAEEVAALRATVGPVVGGAENLAFDVLNGRMVVGAEVPAEVVIDAVAGAGLRAEVWLGRTPATAPEDTRRVRLTALASTSGALAALGFGLEAWAGQQALAHASEAMAVLLGLWVVLPKALLAVRRLRPDMNLLMTIAVLGAVGLGEWLEAATVSFLFATSLALESWSAARARRAIASLLDLSPVTARVKAADGSESEVPPERVPVGAVFVVHPGERIPLDGRVLAGESAVNEAAITGESAPASKVRGALVYAGTVNGDGALEAENLKPAQETTLAHVVRMVEQAQGQRAAVERWVDRFAAYYTPAVMAVAAAVLLGPPLLLGADWSSWIYRSLVLLVIACPCALVISTPVTVVSALAAAARGGVLVKGGEHLEVPARLGAIAFDKTGTLTQGRPRVEKVVAMNGHSDDELLARAAALEARSTHPIAQAILDHSRTRGVAVSPADGVRALPGRGVTGSVGGRPYWLGSHRVLDESGAESPEVHALAEQLADGGRTVVAIGSADHVCGLIALADAIRPEAKEALHQLRRAGVKTLVMLTGDNEETARRIAAGLGIDEVMAELLPEDKVAAMDALVARHGTVAMVGDGVNDAPAMARATIGIAMGAAGSDTAIETADIALMADDLTKLPWLVVHSRRMLSVVRQNVAFSLGVKALFAALAFAGVATLWGAIAADMGASLLVVFNGLRMLRAEPQRRSVLSRASQR
ncbi:MAG: heavy metal translocating P-type ATPase [Anaeromyxobacteraceae bacterium]|nr:heavy metal translocating P-type ATPase [Anaeromyxobacteraceae bacterium]